MVAFATPTIRVHHMRRVDDPAQAGPDTRPEAEQLQDMIASFEEHLAMMSPSSPARPDFEEAVTAMKTRLAEIRREQGQSEPPGLAPIDERQNPTP